MVKVAIYPPNSLVLADLIERKGHTALALQKEMRKKIKDPEIDSPPMNITEEDPIKGLQYAAIEVPSGVRGRMAIIGPLIDEAEAAILVDGAPYGFGCVGCQRTNELSIFCLRKKDIPQLELEYPSSREGAMDMVNQVNEFLDSLDNPEALKEKSKQIESSGNQDISTEDNLEEEPLESSKTQNNNEETPSEEHMKTEEERKVSKDDLVASLKSKGGY
jgi:putative methanogenesis marker protein 5